MSYVQKDVGRITFPKIQPEKAVGDYMQSKIESKLEKKYPEWDVPRVDPAMELVVAKRDLYDVEQRLQQKRDESESVRFHLNDQWKNLADEERKLKYNFMKFNKFVRENQEKRERAERKIAEEVMLQEKRDAIINDLEQRYERMQDIKEKMEANIKSHKLYEHYLQDVVKFAADFKNVNEILNRFETLTEARKVLAERQNKELTALENARNEMLKITEKRTLEIMGLNNQVADLQDRYDIAKRKALHWETMVTKIKNTAAMKMVELHQVRESCWSLYLQMCERKEMDPEFEKEDIENQLLFIKRTMLELKKITRLARKRASKGGAGSLKGGNPGEGSAVRTKRP